MIKFLVFIFTINIFSSSMIDTMFKKANVKIKTINHLGSLNVKSLVGTWITDSHTVVEITKEEKYYIGIIKSDPYDSTSTFLNGEAILRLPVKASRKHIGRVKVFNDNKLHKEWLDTSFKISRDTIFDGYNLYRKVLDSKLKIKKKRINKKNLELRVQATKQLRSSDWKQRLEGINTIIRLNDYSTIPQLTPLLFDQNDSVRKATYYLLKKFNKERNIAGLSQILKDSEKLSNSKKRRINNTSLDGIWTNANSSLQIYLGTDNSITITVEGKLERGLYISDGEKQLALQLDNDSEQTILIYDIKGTTLSLKSPSYKNELLLEKLK